MDSVRMQKTINSGWFFSKGKQHRTPADLKPDRSWEEVEIPHSWNIEDAYRKEPGFYRGEGWYCRDLHITRKNQRCFYLLFEGANQDCAVYINGIKAGEHHGGYNAFTVEITPLLKKRGTDRLTVRVSNAYNQAVPPVTTGDYTQFGGIYRNVHLITVSPVHFDLSHAADGVYITPCSVTESRALLDISGSVTCVSGSARSVRVGHRIISPSGICIAETAGNLETSPGRNTDFGLKDIPVKQPELWSPENPVLYTDICEITDIETGEIFDRQAVYFGIRSVSVDPRKGFSLNRKKRFIKCVGKHQEYPGMGFAVPDRITVRDARLLRDMGAEMIRSHYPLSQRIYETGDRIGLMGFIKIPVMFKVNHTKAFFRNTKVMMKETILQYYNHPSVVLWGSSCEPFGDMDWFWPKPHNMKKVKQNMKQTVDFFTRIEEVIRKLDPYRPTSSDYHTDPNPQWHAESGILDIQSINGWNLYQGWYHADLSNLTHMLRRIETWEKDRPYMIAEYGAGSDERIHTFEPTIHDFSPEYQDMLLQHYMETAEKHAKLCGLAIWTFVDYHSDGRGDTIANYNNKGLMTTDRRPKDAYYLQQAWWSDKPMVHIASSSWTRRVGVPLKNKTVRQKVRIYSNCAEAELFLNGTSLKTKRVQKHTAVWKVPFTEGENSLQARAHASSGPVESHMTLTMRFLPQDLSTQFPEYPLCINAGQSRTYFTDPKSNEIWLPDCTYSRGSYGHTGGSYYTHWPEMKAFDGIRQGISRPISGTDNDPLFQTFLIGPREYRIDAPQGEYRLELLMCEPFDRKTRKDPSAKTGAAPDGKRVFSISVNGTEIIQDLDIARQYGELRAVTRRFNAAAEDKGIRIRFIPSKGKPVLSGIRLEKIS